MFDERWRQCRTAARDGKRLHGSTRGRAHRWALAAGVLMLQATRLVDAAGTIPAVTPYRPGAATPAALSAPGWLELEAGGNHDGDAGAGSVDSVPYTLKLAFSPDWGVRVDGEAWVRGVDGQGRRISGFGDTSLVLKRRWAVNEASALGLELGSAWATAREGLHSGSGGTDLSLNGIYSTDVGPLHADVNLMLTRLGRVDPGQARMQALWALALSGNCNPRWGWSVEASGTRQQGAESTAQALVALSFSPVSRIAWDGGVAKGIVAGSAVWSAFGGVTVVVGRVF